MKDFDMREPCLCEEHELHRDRIDRGRASMPPETEILRLAEFFKVLSDPTRVRIMLAIDGGPLCVCDIAELLGMTKSAVSHQLKILRQSDLVTYKRSGKNIFYELADEHVRDIIECALDHIRE